MSVEPELPTGADAPVTTTVTRRIKAGHEAAYEAFLAGISGAARAFPGYLGVEVFRPTPGRPRRRVPDRLPLRLGRPPAWPGWTPPNARPGWQRAEPHVAGPMRTQFLVGLEGWFTLPTQPGVAAAAAATRWPWSPGRRSSR